MTYDEALAFWYGRINYEHKTPKTGDFTLDRIRALLRLLGDPHKRLRIVHIAGSKGKGSTAAMLASIFRKAGYRTGLFTSPHLVHVEERVQVDGEPLGREELAALLADVRAAVEARKLEPTFFEIATAVGFLHFVRRRVDLAVVEVGLGGRLDSTNVCHPLVAVITSISHDHTQMLGSQLASIAAEKAGIVKTGVPVVSGATVADARDVIERTCQRRSAPLWQLGVDFGYEYEPGRVTPEAISSPRVRVVSTQSSIPSTQYSVLGTRYSGLRDPCPPHGYSGAPALQLGLLGEHQAANAAVAVAVVERLRAARLQVTDKAVRSGLAAVEWPARLEVVGRRPLVVLDCAHNVASALALVQTLDASFPKGRRLLIFACSADKDLAGIFRVLAPHFQRVFLTAYTTSTRAVAPERLAESLCGVADLPFTICPRPADAWRAARASACPDDMICITGSVFLAGELRPLLISIEGRNLH
jgi:dihydrofolate synthase/folylpolyglutamate synthase